jgi:prepilin signal peptidase PulO-like enzyme (type II secretory pathway)
MFLVFYIFVFLIGISIGSFLNCVIYRMELQEDMPENSPQRKAASFLHGKSFCPNCKHTLNWQDLFPVFSFLFLKGRCRYCSKKISIQYPVVELLTGLLFLLVSIRFSVIPNLIGNPGISQTLWIPAFAGMTAGQAGMTSCLYFLFLLLVSSLLIIIFVYDLKHYIIPDKVLFPAIGIVLIYRLSEGLIINRFSVIPNLIGNPGILQALWIPVLAGLGASAFFLFFFLISKGRWMGFGDVKLTFFMGLFLGYPNILVALFLAFLLGAIIGVGLIAFGSKSLKSEVPFGPFLIIGTFIALFYGKEIIEWYMHLVII